MESFAALPLHELPLTEENKIGQVVQIGGKQLLVWLQVSIDPSLLPAEEAAKLGKEQLDQANMLLEQERTAKLETDKRQYKELMESIAAMKNPQEQLALLQNFLHAEKQKNKVLLTKHNKMKDQKDKLTKYANEANKFVSKPVRNPPTQSKEPTIDQFISSLATGSNLKPETKPRNAKEHQKQEALRNMCSCGGQATIRGYCIECIQKLKSRFDLLAQKHAKLLEERSNFNTSDFQKANEKLQLMKAKAAQFEVKLSDNQMLDMLAQNERFFETDDHKELAALRVEIQGIKLQM